MLYVVWYACASVNEGPLRKGEFLHSYKRRDFASQPEQVHRKTNSIAIAEEAANDGVKSGDNGKWRRMQKGEPILIFGRWLIQKDTKPSLSRVDTKVTKRGRNSDSTDKKIGSRFYIQKQMSDLDLRHQIFDSTAGEPTSRRETGNLILSHILMRKIPKSRFMNFGGSVKICSY